MTKHEEQTTEATVLWYCCSLNRTLRESLEGKYLELCVMYVAYKSDLGAC